MSIAVLASSPALAEPWCGDPQSLAEAVLALDECLDEVEKQTLREASRDSLFEYHFSYGMAMRNEWGLWRETALARQFESNGVFHPDDMSGLIIDIYWKHLNGLRLDLRESVAQLRNEYDELLSTVDTSGVVITDTDIVIPLLDPSKVTDELIVLEK